MTTHDVAGVYDAMAPGYDEQLAGDGWMRELLWSRYVRLFRAGDRVLDVGCGTGIDALFLAGRGVHVTGIDLSQGMVEKFRQKATETGLEELAEARVMALAEIGAFPPESLDGIISGFAGLSTTADLTPFAADAARLLRPGGRLIVHMLNQFSLWEWLGAVRRGEWETVRELGRQSEREFTLDGKSARLYLHHPREAYRRCFQSHFELEDCQGLGILRPPHTIRRIPRPVAEILGRLERTVDRRPPFLNWGRFFLLEMVKRDRSAWSAGVPPVPGSAGDEPPPYGFRT